MRLSQTPADISDHQRRIADTRRLSAGGAAVLGVGAAWMSESLEPRSAPGENRWGFGAPVTESYAVGQFYGQTAEERRKWLEAQHAERGAMRTMEWTTTDALNALVRDWRAGRFRDTDALIQQIMKDLRVDRNAALKYYNLLTSKGLLGAKGKTVTPVTPKTSSAYDLNSIVRDWRAGHIRDANALIERIRTGLDLKDRNAAHKYYTMLRSKGLLGQRGTPLNASEQRALERLEDAEALKQQAASVGPSEADHLLEVTNLYNRGRIQTHQGVIAELERRLKITKQQAIVHYNKLRAAGRLKRKETLTASQERALERKQEQESLRRTPTSLEEKKGSRNGIPSAAGEPLDEGLEGEDGGYYRRQAPAPVVNTAKVLDELAANYRAGRIKSPDALVAEIMKRLKVDRGVALDHYTKLRSKLTPAPQTVTVAPAPAKRKTTVTTPLPGTQDARTEAMLTGLVIYWSQGRYKDSNALIADIEKRLGVNPTEAVRLYKTIQFKLITNPYKAPPQPGQTVQPRQVPQPQTALPAAKTSGGRTTVKKRRTGEADRPHEARILARWNVQNQGDLSAKASLRLRMGARRILATSMPVDVIGGSRRGLMLQWSVPIDMVLGSHDLSLDIFQTHRADGVKHDKVVATHGVTIDVVEPSGQSSARTLPVYPGGVWE